MKKKESTDVPNLSTSLKEKNENQKKWQKFSHVELSSNLFKYNSMIDLVKYPVITEKTYIALYKNRQYTFDVDKRLSKPQIKKLFENLFNVNILSVNTHIPPRKKLRVGSAQGYRPSYKRTIVTLKEGQSIKYNLKDEN